MKGLNPGVNLFISTCKFSKIIQVNVVLILHRTVVDSD